MNERDIEIVGLNAENYGRSCVAHSCCGQHVVVGDLLRLVDCVVTVDGFIQGAIKCVKIVEGTEACTVEFVPRTLARNERIQERTGEFVQVLELYANSESSHKRKKSYGNKGMASCIFLNSIPTLGE